MIQIQSTVVVVIVHVVIVVVHVVVVFVTVIVVVDPKNLPIKFGQNLVGN